MADSKAKITAEMQAEDNYRKSLNADAACVWKKNSGKTLPKKVRDSKRYKCRYSAHTKALKHAFESGVFEVKHEEGIGFGVLPSRTCLLQMQKTNEKLNAFGHALKHAPFIMEEMAFVLKGG